MGENDDDDDDDGGGGGGGGADDDDDDDPSFRFLILHLDPIVNLCHLLVGPNS